MKLMMNQIQHLECEIAEFKIELQRHKDAIANIQRFIRDKETQLHYHIMKTEDGSLKQLLSIDGYMTDNCNNICNIVDAWLPDKLDGGGEYSQGWDDCIDHIKGKIK